MNKFTTRYKLEATILAAACINNGVQFTLVIDGPIITLAVAKSDAERFDDLIHSVRDAVAEAA